VTGFCFAGSIHVNSGSLQRRFLTVQAQFDLPATRIPASLHGNVFSLTRADTQGLVHGAVWGDMFSFGDQWSKCWMNVRQTIFAQIPGMVWPFNGFLPIASNATSFNLLDLDDHIQVGTNRLPGLIAMPIVGFPVGPGVNLQAVLEFWFDIQMEGDDSNMTFGFEPPSFSNMVQTFQWKLSKM
jgi:hypothetical protein